MEDSYSEIFDYVFCSVTQFYLSCVVDNKQTIHFSIGREAGLWVGMERLNVWRNNKETVRLGSDKME